MILVTVGATRPFDRLVEAADELALLVDEPLIIQCGAGSYKPRFASHVDFVDEAQMRKWLSESRVVVSHAGGGSIFDTLQAGKPLVLAPRIARLGEHIDDHQFELAEALAAQERTVVVTDLSTATLVEAISQAEQLQKEVKFGESGLHAALRDWLAEQAAGSPPRRCRLLPRKRRRR
jgi:UDP-N-acetylglucosamine transferase subunit ALG13